MGGVFANDIFDLHDLRVAFNSSIEMNSASPFSIFFFLFEDVLMPFWGLNFGFFIQK